MKLILNRQQANFNRRGIRGTSGDLAKNLRTPSNIGSWEKVGVRYANRALPDGRLIFGSGWPVVTDKGVGHPNAITAKVMPAKSPYALWAIQNTTTLVGITVAKEPCSTELLAVSIISLIGGGLAQRPPAPYSPLVTPSEYVPSVRTEPLSVSLNRSWRPEPAIVFRHGDSWLPGGGRGRLATNMGRADYPPRVGRLPE